MQTIQILNKKDVEELVAHVVAKEIGRIADEIMTTLEQRLPTPGPKTLRDDESVDMLALSVRAANIVNSAGITTIGQLTAKTEWELYQNRNCGRVAMLEIKTRLARHGRTLAERES